MKLRRERGNSLIEFSLLTPWLILLFVGAMDWGFYAYSLIATEAAARVGCLYASSSSTALADTTTICTYALKQLNKMPNVGDSMASCASGSSVSSGSPVGISATSVTGASSADGNSAAQVSVTYLTPVFIPMILGTSTVVPKQVTITRTIQMRMRS
jgi:Flp pilus assembly protein TadG